MNKLFGTLVLTVAVVGNVFASPPSAKVENPVGDFSSQALGGLGGKESLVLQGSMNSSYVLGAEGFSISQIDGHSSHLSKRVESSEDLVADYDSDDEKEEKHVRISRQNSQEKLNDVLSPEQNPQGFKAKCVSAIKYVKDAVVRGFYKVKTFFFG